MTAVQHQSTFHATPRQLKVISVLLVERVEFIIPLADALIEEGLLIAEVAFRTRHAADVICRIRTGRPNLTVGAGTVLPDEDLTRAVDAGAMFEVGVKSPGAEKSISTFSK